MKTVYLAGPEVFRPDAMELGLLKKAICRDFGFEGLFPLDNAAPPGTPSLGTFIYNANVAMIERADFVVFNLTPFRGPSADVGTAFELGLAIGLDKPAFAYSNEADDFLARLHRDPGLVFDATTNLWRDARQMAAEDFGNVDNLMIDASLEAQGHRIHRRRVEPDQHYTDLEGFRDCLREAQAYFRSRAAQAA